MIKVKQIERKKTYVVCNQFNISMLRHYNKNVKGVERELL